MKKVQDRIQKAAVKDFAVNKMTMVEVAKKYNTTQGTISKWCKKWLSKPDFIKELEAEGVIIMDRPHNIEEKSDNIVEKSDNIGEKSDNIGEKSDNDLINVINNALVGYLLNNIEYLLKNTEYLKEAYKVSDEDTLSMNKALLNIKTTAMFLLSE